MPRHRFGPCPAWSTRRGAVTLEFIVALPVLLIVLFAVVEFGMFFSNMQQVNLACRVGAEAASQTGALPNTGLVPTNVTDAIRQQLSSSGLSYNAVILEHNVNVGGFTYTLTSPHPLTTTCTPPVTPLPAIAARSVRVTVCVPMSKLAPNCLALFHFDLAGRYAQCSTTFRYELSTP